MVKIGKNILLNPTKICPIGKPKTKKIEIVVVDDGEEKEPDISCDYTMRKNLSNIPVSNKCCWTHTNIMGYRISYYPNVW